MKRFIIAFVLLCVLVENSINAQVVTANQFQNKADAAYELKDYNTALAHYLTILNDEPDRTDLYWKAAEAARLTRHFTVAEKYYEALSKKTELSKAQPLLDYKLATIKKSLGKYDAAVALFQKYTTTAGEVGTNATKEIEDIKWAQEISLIKPYDVIHLDDKVNTNYVDAAPVQYGSTLYYTSAYFKTPDALPVTNIFSSNLKDKGMPLAINSQVATIHTAHYAPNTEGSRLYYNLCEQSGNGAFGCQIYVRAKSADGTWDKPTLLDTTIINISGTTSTQPNIGFDITKGKDVLYFVSDRKGGKGGLDIWAADIEANGTVNAPVNLTAINTAKDDITPFYMNGSQILLFSTEGGQTLGGFDIFKSVKTTAGFGEAVNFGYPLNSSYDDTYASFSPENARYFFASNRPGMCDPAEADCSCNDIYMQNVKLSLDASTFLADGGKSLIGCRLDLLDLKTGEIIKYEVNTSNNKFQFPLEPNREYRIIASKQAYMPDTINFNTYISGYDLTGKAVIEAGETSITSSGMTLSNSGIYNPVSVISKKLILKPNLKLQIYVFDKIDRSPLDGSTIEIRSEDGKILYATETLKGNLMTWEGIEFGKTYLLLATKETYDKDDEKLSIDTWSSTITKFVYTDSLYLTPFSGLPLTLYYDNDYPNPRTRAMTTIYTYTETFVEYYAKQTEYLNAYYTENHDVSSIGSNEISNFFQNNIKFGFDKLNDFSNKLLKYLNNGYGMEIILEGYASPLAQNDYNINLTSRRVSAVINHFYKYQGGIFRQFIKNGQLRLRIEHYGEEKAASSVSDDVNNRRKSVYSVDAMKERKVEIKKIDTFKYDPKDGYNISDALGIYLDTEEFARRKKITTLGDVDDANAKSPIRKGNRKVSSNSRSSKTSVGELGVKYANELPVSKKAITRKRYELVFVDSYTGEVINNAASVELFDQNADKIVAKGKRKGKSKSYYYNVETSKDYLVKGTVPGYSEGTVTKYSGYTEGGISTDTMYLSPFSGLPLTLYFDNDKPPVGATVETTSSTYDVDFKRFNARKREFIGAYNKLVAAQGSVSSNQNEMNTFFEQDIKGGYSRLVGYSSIMKSYLERGYQLEVKIEGYASPLANAEYNQKLAARRVNSVINHFSSVAGGSMKQYISSGQLKISVQPMGEVNTTVNDDINNLSSIYSLGASRERKVIVKDIIILNNVFRKN